MPSPTPNLSSANANTYALLIPTLPCDACPADAVPELTALPAIVTDPATLLSVGVTVIEATEYDTVAV